MAAEIEDKILLIVGNEVLKNKNWVDYANYCFEREKGLRKNAFIHLNNFLASTEVWSMEDKISFVKFLLSTFDTIKENSYACFPNPLNSLIEPTLINLCQIEKTNGNAFRWLGTYYESEKYLLEALNINPNDDVTREILLKRWVQDTYFSVHHLPDGYIGEPNEDLELGIKALKELQNLKNIERQKYWKDQLEEDLELIRNYIEWKKSGHIDFKKWGKGKENKKKVGYNYDFSQPFDNNN